MDPDDINTLVSLLGRTDPGASNTADLINTYSGNIPQPGQSAPGSNIIPNPKNQKPQSLGLFNASNSSMLGQSPLSGQGMLGQSPYGGQSMLGSDPNQW